jgi:uncharacterized membrane protein YfcA
VSQPDLLTLTAATCAAAVVTGFLRNAVGGGIGLTLTPLLTLVLPPTLVLAMLGLLLLASDPISLRLYWKRWDHREAGRLLPTMLVGILLGGWLVASVSPAALRRIIGAAALLFGLVQIVAMLRRRPGPSAPVSPAISVSVGLAAGVASTVAHSGGVVVGLYLVTRPLTNAGIVATGTVLYAMSDLVKVSTYWLIGWITPALLLATGAALPMLYLGSWLGYRLNARLPRRAFALALLGFAFASALRLLLS